MKIILISVLSIFSVCLEAFEINVDSSYLKSEGKFEEKWPSSPAHENIIANVIKKLPNDNYNSKEKVNLIIEIATGTRWNDDPLDLIRKKKKDALLSFIDSCNKENSYLIDSSWDLMYRTHCGDMQFLHSMASSAKESANLTKRKILAWSEFAYKTSVGSIPLRLRFRSIQLKMTNDNAQIFKTIMVSNSGGRAKWTPYILFAQSCDRDFSFFLNGSFTTLKCVQKHLKKSQIYNMALGSLIHIVQDSFSKSHTQRKGGLITKFGIYSSQNAQQHKKQDKHYDDSDRNYNNPNLYTILSEVLRLALNDRNNQHIDNWPKVQASL